MREREFRSMEMRISDSEEVKYAVEGYASTFERYKLFEEEGTEYFEQIDPKAFDDADMTDCVFRVDHEGPVYARTSAGTVEVWVDEHGLAQRTDLSKTQRARDLFEDIKAYATDKVRYCMDTDDKLVRDERLRVLSEELTEQFIEKYPEMDTYLGECLYKIQKSGSWCP